MKKTRLLALLLAAAVLLCALPGGVLAADDRMEISTAAELIRLSDKCRLDSWSVGKTIVLMCDIDLTGTDFEPIPSFGGIFEGGGYTISGLVVKNGGSAVGGLFRFVQEGALIRDLNVEGEICPDMNRKIFGGIAGENSGKISNCSFSGTVSGESETGGIVGLNTATGELRSCRSLAHVSGEHYTGGIAGRNSGSIVNCTNLGAVNTTNPEITEDTLDIDWTNLNSMENAAAHTDTGGITGYSDGALENCVNRGNVGYPHVGYNVGGIAGRQSGFVDGCRNFGLVNGRKDVGGVVGQMVPSIRLQLSSSAIAELRAEMDVLQTLLDDLITDFQDSSNNISGIISDAGDYLKSAGESATAIGDALTEFVDGNVENLNSMASTAAKYAQRLSDVISHAKDSFSHLTAAGEYLAEFVEAAGRSGADVSAVLDHAMYAAKKLDDAKAVVNNFIDACTGAVDDISASIERGDELEALAGVLEKSADNVKDAFVKLGSIDEILDDALKNGLEPALAELETIVGASPQLSEPLKNAAEELGLASSDISMALSGLEKWIRDLSAEEPGEFKELGDEFVQDTDRLNAAIAGLGGEMEKLNKALSGSSNIMSEDLRLINDQFFKVMDCVMNLLEGSGGEVSVYEDMSEEELFSATEGKVQDSENRGAVAGDVNVGGLVGTMAIEYDLDPEEDISVSGSSGGTLRYFTRAVLMNSVNFQPVIGKKDAVGGAVGYMNLGIVYGCENYGSISSSSGDYVGGIAGQSAATVKNCWSLCSLSGRDYVGGIAGSATDISGCRCIVELSATGGWKGAIAGEVLGEAAENFFVGEGQGGIDGVSYAGKAEPQEYGDFILAEDMPGEFTDFKLTFVAGNISVKSVNFSYGDSIDHDEIPPVPEKTGHVGEWEDYDFDHLTFSGVVDAVYTPYDTVVAVPEQEGKRTLVLLEGAFLPGSVPVLEKRESGLEGALEAWTVTADGSVDGRYTVRYLAPDKAEKLEIRVLSEGVWKRVDTRTEGSYILFEGEGESLSFAAVELDEDFSSLQVLVIAAAAVLMLLVIVLRARTLKKRRRAIAEQKQSDK